jgi:hypothetical protein
MNNKYNKNESGAILPFVLLIIMVLLIAFLGYLLTVKKSVKKLPPEIYTEYETKPSVPEFEYTDNFDDGLKKPYIKKTFTMNETGDGITSTEVFNIDINKDNLPDKITKNRYENGTAHFYYEYKIELNLNNKFVDITPKDFRTAEGAECSLLKFRFIFSPDFEIIKISRNWQESWATPTMATEYIYIIENNVIKNTSATQLSATADVTELFY